MVARSGQYALIEQVLLFGAGIAIALGFMVAFNDMASGIQADTAETQTRLVSKMVAADTVELVESGLDGQLLVSIPASVATQEYAIVVTDTGVETVTLGAQYTAALYGLLHTNAMGGVAESGTPQIMIAKDGQRVEVSQAQ